MCGCISFTFITLFLARLVVANLEDEIAALCVMYTNDYFLVWDIDPCDFSIPCQQYLYGVSCYDGASGDIANHVAELYSFSFFLSFFFRKLGTL